MPKAILGVDNRLKAEGPITKTANYNGVAVDMGAGWAPDGARPLGVLIDIDALDFTTTDETYTFKVEESSDNSSFTATGCQFVVTATGVVEQFFKSTKRYVRLVLTVGGTTPSLTYTNWFAPVIA